jgi:PAS domain S-box-containing protein
VLEKAVQDQQTLEGDLQSQIMLLQSIAESPSAISIVSTDLNGNILYWNKGAENLLGHRAEDVVGLQKIGIVYPDNTETKLVIRHVVEYLLKEKKGITCEVDEITKDGRLLNVKLTLSPRFDADGRVVGILGIGENATERKLAEKALAERVRMAAFGAEVGSVLVSGSSLQLMLQKCVDEVELHIESSLVRIWTLHPGDNTLELQAGSQSNDHYPSTPHSLIKHIAREHKPYLTNSLQTDKLLSCQSSPSNFNTGSSPATEIEAILAKGITSFAGYPLMVGSRTMGVLEIFSKIPLTEAEQHTLGIVANEIAMSIERIWAYAVVRASEERIRAIVANALDGIITIYHNGIIESFNPAAETIFGYKAQETLGKNISLLIPEAHQSDPGRKLHSFIQTGEEGVVGRVIEVVGLRNNSISFPMEVAISKLQIPERRRPSRMQEGRRPMLFICMVRDITERKRFETILREERDYSAQLAEKTPALICGMTPGGIIHFINPAVEKNTGFLASDLIGKNWWRKFYPDEDYEQVEKLFSALAQGPVTDHEMLMTIRSGEKRLVAWSFVNRFDETGKIIEIIGFGVDLTERKKVENELILAAQQAEESNRLKSTFLSVMSHELRTPLTVLLGNTPLLTDINDIPPPNVIVEIGEDMETSGKHLLALIDDLLDFSKIEAGRMALNFETFSLKTLVDEVVSNVEVIADKKGLAIHTRMEDLDITADPVRLKQILLNILGNSVKFTDQGEINFVVEKKGEMVSFRIQDTGCGIAENDLPIIFDSFRQADASVTRSASGTGLGLAITKKLVEMHDGSIFAESILGQGTIITFTLPIIPPKGKNVTDFHMW